MLHAWKKFGLEEAEREFLNKYESKHRHYSKEIVSFQQVIRGKIEFLGMVKGKNDPIYKKFLNQYLELNNRDKDLLYKIFLWFKGK
jgi:RNA-directed DNA polymerase